MTTHKISRMAIGGALCLAAVVVGGSAVVAAQVDTDADGIEDAQEAVLGTDPAVADSDGDGLGDGVEVALNLDPLAADSDGDGVSDPSEYLAGSDPLDPASTPGGFGAPVTVSPITEPVPPVLAFDDGGARDQRTAAWLLIALAVVGFTALSYTARARLVEAREVTPGLSARTRRGTGEHR